MRLRRSTALLFGFIASEAAFQRGIPTIPYHRACRLADAQATQQHVPIVWAPFPSALPSASTCINDPNRATGQSNPIPLSIPAAIGGSPAQPARPADFKYQRYSSSDWFRIMLNTPTSVVLRRVWQPVLFTTVFSLFVHIVFRLSPTVPSFSYKPHSLIGSALSLLLVFRTNAAYTRFWEGRQRWQLLSDHIRSLSRLVMLYEQQAPPPRAPHPPPSQCTPGRPKLPSLAVRQHGQTTHPCRYRPLAGG